jgi:hypothetical protein
MTRDFTDSREGFAADEFEAYQFAQDEPTDGDYAECEIYWDERDAREREDEIADHEWEDDGQPTEYEEWQDFYGGDDWDHGQYDDYGDY